MYCLFSVEMVCFSERRKKNTAISQSLTCLWLQVYCRSGFWFRVHCLWGLWFWVYCLWDIWFRVHCLCSLWFWVHCLSGGLWTQVYRQLVLDWFRVHCLCSLWFWVYCLWGLWFRVHCQWGLWFWVHCLSGGLWIQVYRQVVLDYEYMSVGSLIQSTLSVRSWILSTLSGGLWIQVYHQVVLDYKYMSVLRSLILVYNVRKSEYK